MNGQTEPRPDVSFVISESEYNRLTKNALFGMECGIISGGLAYFTTSYHLDSLGKMRKSVKDGSFKYIDAGEAVRQIQKTV